MSPKLNTFWTICKNSLFFKKPDWNAVQKKVASQIVTNSCYCVNECVTVFVDTIQDIFHEGLIET